jgi:hypothetical protein
MKRMKPLCVHCHVYAGNRARGLCWNCSRKPEVRALYPNKHGHVGEPSDAEVEAMLAEAKASGLLRELVKGIPV